MKQSYFSYRRAAWLAAGVAAFAFIGIVAWAVYVEGHREPTPIDAIAEALHKEIEQADQEANADTKGGITPADTLHLYIAAFEKNDIESAASYFVPAKRTLEAERLRSISESVRPRLLELLHQAEQATGTYSFAKDAYTIRDPILVDFIRYPNGIWKLVDL